MAIVGGLLLLLVLVGRVLIVHQKYRHRNQVLLLKKGQKLSMKKNILLKENQAA
jgi:hypothetical protein